MTFAPKTPALTITIIDKITIYSNEINNTTVCLITGNKYSTLLCHKDVNDGLGIKSTAGLKTFVEEQNGHNAFAHPRKFDEQFK